MSKITFLGAGSTVFAKNVLGDVMLTPALQGFELALFDIDQERLKDSENMLLNLKETTGSTCRHQSIYRSQRSAARRQICRQRHSGRRIRSLHDHRFRSAEEIWLAPDDRAIRSASAAFSATCARFRSCSISPEICRKFVRMRCS